MQEALSFKQFKNLSVRCQVCQKGCLIAPGEVGYCRTKQNLNGILYALNYGLIQGVQTDPIEKKPFYHFNPGAMVPSVGSLGCNFRCKQCLNSWCSWGEPAGSTLKALSEGKRLSITSPKDLITEIQSAGGKGIAFTYNEPTIWAEYVLDTAKLAKEKGMFTLYVTNGSWTKETLDKIGPYIDAANVDLKGFSDASYIKQDGIFGTILEMLVYAQKKHHLFLEITTLLIPGINDDPQEIHQMTRWIKENLGPNTPWHLSQFDPHLAPDKEFKKIPFTRTDQLADAAQIGRDEGLNFVYIWATSSNYIQADTYCPKCKNLAITRRGYQTQILGVNEKGNCLKCNEVLNIVL